MHFTALVLLLCIIINSTYQDESENLEILYEWKFMNIDISDVLKSNLEFTVPDDYNPKNAIVTSMKRYKDKIYLALPRIKPTVSITMGWIPANPVDGNKSPLLKPFPSWKANLIDKKCSTSLRSVNGFEIDKDGMMWVLDSGKNASSLMINQPTDCPPAIALIDLNEENPTIQSKFEIPDWLINFSTYLNDIVIDEYDGGYAYFTDSSPSPGIFVYGRRRNKFWKFTHQKSMDIDPEANSVKINNIQFDINYRLNGIALGPQYYTSSKKLIRNIYYAPVSSRSIYVLSSDVLRSEAIGDARLIQENGEAYFMKYVGTLGKKSAQSASMIADENGKLYYGMLGEQKIKTWKEDTSNWDFVHENATWREDNPKTMIEQEFIQNDKLDWMARFDIDKDGNLYVLSNNYHTFTGKTLDTEVVNFRIFKSNIGAKSYLHGKSLK